MKKKNNIYIYIYIYIYIDRAIRKPIPWAQRKRGRPNKASWPLAEEKKTNTKAYDVNN